MRRTILQPLFLSASSLASSAPLSSFFLPCQPGRVRHLSNSFVKRELPLVTSSNFSARRARFVSLSASLPLLSGECSRKVQLLAAVYSLATTSECFASSLVARPFKGVSADRIARPTDVSLKTESSGQPLRPRELLLVRIARLGLTRETKFVPRPPVGCVCVCVYDAETVSKVTTAPCALRALFY